MQWVPNQFAFGSIATSSTKAKDHAQVACISILIGCVSVDRAKAVLDERSRDPLKLEKPTESSHRDMAKPTSWNKRPGGRVPELLCLVKIGEANEGKP